VHHNIVCTFHRLIYHFFVTTFTRLSGIMPWDGQTTIALITLIVSCPPTVWMLYALLARRRLGNRQRK
jgi:hypothetical protein